ncbi:hypothetical protein CVT26_006119, partial [Gymnopilus dilepis]
MGLAHENWPIAPQPQWISFSKNNLSSRPEEAREWPPTPTYTSTRGPHRIQPRRYEAIERSMGCRSTNQQSRPSTTTLGIAPALVTTPLSPARPQTTTSNRASRGKHLGDISAARIGSRGLESQCLRLEEVHGVAPSRPIIPQRPEFDASKQKTSRDALPPQTTTPSSGSRGKGWVASAALKGRLGGRGVHLRTCADLDTQQWESRKALEQCWGRKDRSERPAKRAYKTPTTQIRGGPSSAEGLKKSRTAVGRRVGRAEGMRTKGPSTRIQAAQRLKAEGGDVVAGLCACCEPLVSPTPL